MQTESAINVPIRRGRFSGMGFAAVNEEYLPRRCRVLCSPVRILLNALLDQPDDAMFMSVAREAVLDIMRVNNFYAQWRTEAIKANPLCRSRHIDKPHSVGQVYPLAGRST